MPKPALSRWFSREYQAANPAQIAALRQTLAGNDPQGYLTTYELFATQDMYRADDLRGVQAPTLIATGELDPGSTPEMARQLAERIPGASVAVLAEQRHMMPVESPRLVNQLLLEFLDTAHAQQHSYQGDRCMTLARFQMCIGGEWVDALSGKTFESLNPALAEPWARTARCRRSRRRARRAGRAKRLRQPGLARPDRHRTRANCCAAWVT